MLNPRGKLVILK